MNISNFISCWQGIITPATGIFALLITGSDMRAQSISMSYVTVGNPDNAADPATGSLYGSVSYTYDVCEYDVTDSQYVTFLNDVDPTGAASVPKSSTWAMLTAGVGALFLFRRSSGW